MKYIFSLFIILVLFFSKKNSCFAQKDNKTIYPHELSTVLPNCTFFIQDSKGAGTSGTAFVLTKSSEDSCYYTQILITAAHVLNKMKSDTVSIWLHETIDSINFKNYRAPLIIREKGEPVWVQPNKSIDIAIIVGVFSEKIPNITSKFLSSDIIIKQAEVNTGDDVLCLGFPLNTPSNELGFPILRSGKIASYPLGSSYKFSNILVDLRDYEGSSGGPVFRNFQIKIDYSGRMFYYPSPLIIGILSEGLKSVKGEKLDISSVVPSQLIIDAINSIDFSKIFNEK